jgi:PKD repeat protein
MTVDEGAVATQQLTASDPDGDALTYSKVGTTPFFMTVSAAGLVTLSPGFSDAGAFTGTVRVSDGNLTDTKSFSITVNDINRCPVADANGPYNGVVGVPVTFDGSGSTDADGDVLTYTWDFGDGVINGNQAMPQHAYAAAGVYNIILTVSDGQCSSTSTSTATISDVFPAHAFTTGGNNRTSLGSGKPFTYVQVEPVNGSFTIPDVDLGSIKMVSPGTGSVSEIFADASKTVVDGDKNGNGVTEIRAAFSKADLRLLFSNLPNGNQTVTVTIEGNLVGGGRFSATLQHTVKGTGGALAASITRDSFTSKSTLTFHMSKPGAVKVQMFDVNGRLIRTLMDESFAAAGYHDLTIDDRNANGGKVAAGVYFVRVASQHDGTESQKITFVK